jgi:hypothetical protein
MTVTLRAPEVRTFPCLQMRAVDATEDSRRLEGQAVPYGQWTNVGWYEESMARGVFDKSIAEAASVLPLLLWHDNQTWPIGRSSEWSSTDHGLRGVWELDDSSEAARAAQQARDGYLVGMSVGFVPITSTWEYLSDEEWDPDKGSLDRVTRVEGRLLEVSLTPTPAYAGAQVSLVRSAPPERVRKHRAASAAGRAELAGWRDFLAARA